MTRKIFAILCFAFIQSVIAGDKLIEEMLATYEANQARFHTNHRDHLLSGVGTVKKITSDFMGTGSYFKVILDVNGSTIQCSTKNKNMAAKLDKEQIVNFKGTIYDVILNSLIVENCQFTDYTPAVSNRSDDNRDDGLPLKNKNFNGYIYFAADKPPAEKNAPPESPLCYKFKVASIEEQLDKLQKKYGSKFNGFIKSSPDGHRILSGERTDTQEGTITYYYFSDPVACSLYKKRKMSLDDSVLKKISQGMKYSSARETILNAGWAGNNIRWQDLPEFSQANDLYFTNKWHEVQACAGTGRAPCRFEFKDSHGNILVIGTEGECGDDEMCDLEVVGWHIE